MNKNLALGLLAVMLLILFTPFAKASVEIQEIYISNDEPLVGENLAIGVSVFNSGLEDDLVKIEFKISGEDEFSKLRGADVCSNCLGTAWVEFAPTKEGDYRVIVLLDNQTKGKEFHVYGERNEFAVVFSQDWITDDLDYLDYKYDGYNGENIDKLFDNIYQYRTVIVSSFSLDDPSIKGVFNSNKPILKDYVDKGGGLVVFAQNDYEIWLPEEFGVPVEDIDIMIPWYHKSLSFLPFFTSTGDKIDWFSNDISGDCSAKEMYFKVFYKEDWPLKPDDDYKYKDYELVGMDSWFFGPALTVWIQREYEDGRISLTTARLDQLSGSEDKQFFNDRIGVKEMIDWTSGFIYKVDVRVFPENSQINPGEKIKYLVTIKNDGNEKDDFDVRIDGKWTGWAVKSEDDLEPGKSKTFYLKIEPDKYAEPEMYKIKFKADCGECDDENEDKEEITLEINEYKDVEIFLWEPEAKESDKEEFRILGTIENKGNCRIKDGQLEIVVLKKEPVEKVKTIKIEHLKIDKKDSLDLKDDLHIEFEVNDSGDYVIAARFSEKASPVQLLDKVELEFDVEEEKLVKINEIKVAKDSYRPNKDVKLIKGSFTNDGNLPLRGVLIMSVQEKDDGKWKNEKIIVKKTIELKHDESINLAREWNSEGGWETDSGYEKYRVYAAIMDSSGVVEDDTGKEIETYDNFKVTGLPKFWEGDDDDDWFSFEWVSDFYDEIFEDDDDEDDDDDDDDEWWEDLFDIFGDDDDDDDDDEWWEDIFDFGDDDDVSSDEDKDAGDALEDLFDAIFGDDDGSSFFEDLFDDDSDTDDEEWDEISDALEDLFDAIFG